MRVKEAAVLNSVKPTLLMLSFVLLSSGFASAQTSPDIVRQQISLKGTVETIDHTARTVTIRGDKGSVVTLDIPASVKRLDQVKVGDVVQRLLLRPRELAAEARRRGRRRSHPASSHGSLGGGCTAGRHDRLAASHHGHDHRVGSCHEGGDVHRTSRVSPTRATCWTQPTPRFWPGSRSAIASM